MSLEYIHYRLQICKELRKLSSVLRNPRDVERAQAAVALLLSAVLEELEHDMPGNKT